MDVYLVNTGDGGNICLVNNDVELRPGLETMAYLSMFGGNYEDSGGSDKTKQYWGNFNETDPSYMLRGETEYLLRSIPPIPANLRRIEDAATRDLKALVDIGAATGYTVSASMPALNTVKIMIMFEGDETLEFTEHWRQST